MGLLTSFYSAFLTPPQEMADWRSLRPSDVLNALIRTVIINIMLIVLKKTCKGHDTVVSLSAGDETRPAEA